MLESLRVHWREDETRLLQHLRARRMRARASAEAPAAGETRTVGQRVADQVAAAVGCWRFIIIQSCLLVIWMFINVIGWVQAWDPYPFILLNLVLSFQAAYTAPIIMMSQNRQSQIDRDAAQNDYDVNLKSELEVELLHQKLDLIREQELARLITVIGELQAEVSRLRANVTSPPPVQ